MHREAGCVCWWISLSYIRIQDANVRHRVAFRMRTPRNAWRRDLSTALEMPGLIWRELWLRVGACIRLRRGILHCVQDDGWSGVGCGAGRDDSVPWRELRSRSRAQDACCLFRYCGHLAATGFVRSALVADLWMMSAWCPPKTGHEGQFYEWHGWQTGRTQTSTRTTQHASEGRPYEAM